MTGKAHGPDDLARSIRRHEGASIAAVLALVLGVGGLAAFTEVDGAVIAPGLLVVDSNIKLVQHPTGGIVGELKVREGDHVESGSLLLRLDETQTRANLQIVSKQLDEAMARRARAEAERDGAMEIAFPSELSERRHESELMRLMNGETRLFALRAAARSGQKNQLREQIAQLTEQINGLSEQVTAKSTEIHWNSVELNGVRDLWNKKLVQINRVTALERDAARLVGEKGHLVASIAQVRGRIAETELRVLQIDEELRTEVGRELAELRSRIAELVEKRVAAEDVLRRVEIRAPSAGYVHQLAIHTIGGIIAPNGEPIMQIVPDRDTLFVDARVLPQDVDQLYPGQPAAVRLLAANQATTPELTGRITRIAPNVSSDPKTGASYFAIRVSLPDEDLKRFARARLIPGMPVEVFARTSSRSLASYALRPFSDQLRRAFRER
ncbi:hemolysin secretion protein D [Rhodoplanes elegans]|uniref:Membrane fusion protein (MFP) family protein n=1 Tax=Rhodoplanes elegans TaxID=29408 RepID=A0A327KT43_9BRAD|nr:HlyD family type I secretion periplasmic adaptor subunit [Rhodoplanes elegans]MBK5958805.1 hemolysin secretion protein D [Rhodoplanes elegans]RAI38558.1 hemolysin secretion protein D [Rhodoplanes elegans]